jgi:hypothetical protein
VLASQVWQIGQLVGVQAHGPQSMTAPQLLGTWAHLPAQVWAADSGVQPAGGLALALALALALLLVQVSITAGFAPLAPVRAAVVVIPVLLRGGVWCVAKANGERHPQRQRRQQAHQTAARARDSE